MTIFDKNKQFVSKVTVRLTNVRMAHDFPLTKNYAVFPDLPIEFSMGHALWNKSFVFKYNKLGSARYGFLPRYSTNPSDIVWISTPAHCVFHFAAAWEETNEQGEVLLITYGVVYHDIDVSFQHKPGEHPMMGAKNCF